MPAPLLDRMEVIELPGYTSEEKLRIAMLHLLPRVLEQHGITDEHIHIPEVRNLILFHLDNSSRVTINCGFPCPLRSIQGNLLTIDVNASCGGPQGA